MIVIDASVATKLFLPEQDSSRAMVLIESVDRLYAPDLIRVEVAAAIVRAARGGRISVTEAAFDVARWNRTLQAGAITMTPVAEDLEAAAALAITLAHPLQDCLYLALAERLDVPLVTADMAFHAKASPAFPRVMPLAA